MSDIRKYVDSLPAELIKKINELLDSPSVTGTVSSFELWVDGTSGNDNNDGLTALTPKQTFEAAALLVPAMCFHDVIIHVTGTWSAAGFTFSRYVESGKNIRIQGEWSIVDDNSGLNYSLDGSGVDWLQSLGASFDALAYGGLCYLQLLAAGVPVQVLPLIATGAGLGQPVDRVYFPEGYNGGCWYGGGADAFRVVIGPAPSGTEHHFSVTGGGSIWLDRLDFRASALFLERSPAGLLVMTDTSASSLQGRNARIRAGSTWPYGSNPYLRDPQCNICSTASSLLEECCFPALDGSEGGVFMLVNLAEAVWRNIGLGGSGALGSRQLYLVDNSGSPESFLVDLHPGQAYGAQTDMQIMSRNRPVLHIRDARAVDIYLDVGRGASDGVRLQDCNIRLGGGVANMSANAIEVIGSHVYQLNPLGGSGNGGFGVYAHSGAIVEIVTGSPPTLTGTVGDISTDGTTEASTWADVDAGTRVVDLNELTMIKEA